MAGKMVEEPNLYKVALLYTCVSNISEAESLIYLAISNKLAACANIIDNGISIYLWKGKIEKNVEIYIIFKTSINLVLKLEKLILENHPYETPAILKFSAESYNKFFDYISESLM